MSNIKLILIGLLVLGLSGCTKHLTEVECKVMDWKQEGVKDASAGKAPRNLEGSIKDCQKFNISVDTQAYQKGYAEGVVQFCTPNYDTGVEVGKSGKPESEIDGRRSFCINNNKPLVLKDYSRGYKAGIAAYCTFDTGKDAGLDGQAANPSCGNFKTYMQGWNAGSAQVCSNADTAFMYGKTGKPYPAACTLIDYPQFKRQYDRGAQIKQRLDQLNGQVNSINNNINQSVKQYGLVTHNGVYAIGQNTSPEAYQALYNVQNLVNQREQLNKEIFKVNLMQ